MSGPGIDASNDEIIWFGTLDYFSPILREGDPLPGIGESLTFTSSGGATLNAGGQIAMHGLLAGEDVNPSNYHALWIVDPQAPDSVISVVRTGDPAPGTEDGTVFADLRIVRPALNARGQVAFYAMLSGPAVDDSNRWGIWATDPLGELVLVCRAGDSIVLADGSSCTIENIDGTSLLTRSINDHGQIAFVAKPINSTERLIVTTVPESSTAALLATGLLAILWLIRGRVGRGR